MAFSKLEWQRDQRRDFASARGYSQTSDYATGKLREAVLIRDGRKCVRCGMTEAEHLAKWNRPITVDHRDKDRSRNTMENLQTLCLSCHGKKDNTNFRREKVPNHKQTVLEMRAAGATYQAIGAQIQASIGAIHKWVKRWEKE